MPSYKKGAQQKRPKSHYVEAIKVIHENVSRGYWKIAPDGTRTWVEYTREESGEMHSFISPRRDWYKRMKYTKTRDWKDKEKAKKARFKNVGVTYGGLNTVSS